MGTSNRARSRAIRARMDATGEPYTVAARAHDSTAPTGGPGYVSWNTATAADLAGRAARQAEISRRAAALGRDVSWSRVADAVAAGVFDPVGGLVPPDAWPLGAARHPAMLVLYRDRDGVDVLDVLDAREGTTLASLSVPHMPSAELLAIWEAAGLLGVPGSFVRRESESLAGLGRPDLLAHRLGYQGGGRGARWYEWPDGSWRALAKPADTAHTAHTVTASPAGDGALRLVVTEHPAGNIRLDVVVPDVDDTVSWNGLNAALDAHGYTVVHGLWERLPGEIRYAPARPGRLAARDWWTVARVRITRQVTVGAVDPAVDRTFRVGEELTMNQRGRAGREIDRGSWWSGYDIDGAHIISADCVEILDVLEDHPPTL